MQSLEVLRENFDVERGTYLSRMEHLEKELENLRRKTVRPSTDPKEPETQKQDDTATSGEGELRESGVRSREKDSKRDSKEGRAESMDGRGDLSKSVGSEHSSVVVKAGEKEAAPVGWLPQVIAMVLLISIVLGYLLGMRVRKWKLEVETTSSDSSYSSGDPPSVASSRPTTDLKETELVQSVAKIIQAQT